MSNSNEELRQIGFISYQHLVRDLSSEFLDFLLETAYGLYEDAGIHIVVRGLYA